MKITDIKLHVLEVPGHKKGVHQIVQVEGLRRIQYTHHGRRTEEPAHELILRVMTDEGIEGLYTVDQSTYTGEVGYIIELFRENVVGMDAFDRERIFQKLQLGTRWVYQKPGWFGMLDNCLWDIAGKAANQPVYNLIGRVRDSVPVYQTAGDGPVEMYIEHIERGKAMGIRAYKPHSYKGAKADIPIMIKLREYVGPDFDLLLDPVCSYTLREAIEIGHVLEDLDFVWLEEPFHEQRMNDYQELCAELTIPILATEMLMYDMGLTAQWLIQGATDLLRTNARHGATQVLKLAHFAELYGTSIELNGAGGLYGLVHTHLGCCIYNNDFYEYFGDLHKAGEEVGMLNAPQVKDGCLTPPDLPGWGAQWDMERVKKLTVAVL
jgi:L-alanine-DL-glutamate epimerase-like enolase superfamily enzyme